MNLADTAELLTLASAYDGRDVTEDDARAWHLLLGDVDVRDARDALLWHYRHQTWRLMPGHITQALAGPLSADALLGPDGTWMPPDPPQAVMDDQGAYQAWVRDQYATHRVERRVLAREARHAATRKALPA